MNRYSGGGGLFVPGVERIMNEVGRQKNANTEDCDPRGFRIDGFRGVDEA